MTESALLCAAIAELKRICDLHAYLLPPSVIVNARAIVEAWEEMQPAERMGEKG